MTRGTENVLESSTWIWYDTAALTSFQSSAIGRVIVAPLAGLTSTGAGGVCGGVIVSVAVRFTPVRLAVIVTGVDVVTLVVGIATEADALPAGTTTLAGVPAAEELSESVTVVALAGGPLSVTVACDAAPPVTLEGATETDVRLTVPGGG